MKSHWIYQIILELKEIPVVISAFWDFCRFSKVLFFNNHDDKIILNKIW